MNTKRDKIELGLFIARYICTLLVFVLGLKAPGIQSIENEDEAVLIDSNQNENNVRKDLRHEN